MKKCSVPTCSCQARSKGYCNKHYKRLLRYGDPEKQLRIERGKHKTCTVPGCSLAHIARGLCSNHYALMKRNGKPETVRVFKNSYIKDGYRYIYVSYRHYEPEHRLVMEARLGRKLQPDEHVHHIDENTLNNDISNLQLLSASEHMKAHRRALSDASGKARKERGLALGEKNIKAVLTPSQVLEIRSKYSRGVTTLASLGKEYGVTKYAIYDIIHRRSWTHI